MVFSLLSQGQLSGQSCGLSEEQFNTLSLTLVSLTVVTFLLHLATAPSPNFPVTTPPLELIIDVLFRSHTGCLTRSRRSQGVRERLFYIFMQNNVEEVIYERTTHKQPPCDHCGKRGVPIERERRHKGKVRDQVN